MYDDLKGKTALITGAGKKTGIGLAIAEKMASCGANVILADLGKGPESIGGIKMGLRQEMESMAGSLKEKHGVKTLAVDLDVTRNDSLQRMMEKIKEHFDCIDALVNNAGASFGAPSPVQTYDEEAWMKTIDVNLHGTFRVSRRSSP